MLYIGHLISFIGCDSCSAVEQELLYLSLPYCLGGLILLALLTQYASTKITCSLEDLILQQSMIAHLTQFTGVSSHVDRHLPHKEKAKEIRSCLSSSLQQRSWI